MKRIALLALGAVCVCQAQLMSWGQLVPRTAKPPVLFVTGHDAVCPDPRSGETPFFNLTFGKFDEVMARDGRVSFVFEACYAPNRPPIEDIAGVLDRLLQGLVYEDGQPVTEVDVVAHSMGGLILRAYLSGKESRAGSFHPRRVHRIRRAVFVATPHFGTAVADAKEADPQLREMSLGSLFLFELATWNQGKDDLRGVDALSLVGTAGSNGDPGFTDSVVTLTSGSLNFVSEGRTIVLPMCHTFGGIGSLLLCGGAAGLARVANYQDLVATSVVSFLNGNSEWQFSGHSAASHPLLSKSGGLLVQFRDAYDRPVAIRSAVLNPATNAPIPLKVSTAGLAYSERVPEGRAQLTINGHTEEVRLKPYGGQALIIKPGPHVTDVSPVSSIRSPNVLTPGIQASVRGMRFGAGPRVTVAGEKVPITYSSPGQMVIVLPHDLTGLLDLTVSTEAGQHTTRIYVEGEHRTTPAFRRR